MSSLENYTRILRTLTALTLSIDELEQKRKLLLDEVHRVDAQLESHRAYLLKLQIDIDELGIG